MNRWPIAVLIVAAIMFLASAPSLLGQDSPATFLPIVHQTSKDVSILFVFSDCRTKLNNNNMQFDILPNWFVYMYRGQSGCELDAKENWWGTDSSENIGERIYDYSDDFELPKVVFQPFATKPIP
jgi:hypothetical protein